MNFVETAIVGVFVIDAERIEDERGFFARTFCREEFEAHGLNSDLVQCSISFNRRCGTLRGLHFQVPPHEEAKLVRCTRGAIFDVIVDLRRRSSTFMKWTSELLNESNRRMLYIPAGVAHGFQTLADNTEVFYQMSEVFSADCSRGVRWDDPAFAIDWPEAVTVISDRDLSFPDFSP